MRTRRSGQAASRLAGTIGALRVPLSAVAVLLAGLGFLLAPGPPAAAAPPAQGWTSTEAALPTDAGNGSTDPDVYVASSTCPGANMCVTVGWYDDTSGHSWGVIETQNGTNWSETEAPQPSNAGSGSDQGFYFGSQQCGFENPCRAVSCPTTTFCVAVGQFSDTSGYYQPAIDTFSNGAWTSQEGTLPGDTATDLTPEHPDGDLYSVSCASSTSCVAVGSYINTSGQNVGLIDTLSGSTWSGVATPIPSGITATTSYLYGVSCTTASFCVGTGFYDAGSYSQGLLEVWSAGTWTPSTAAFPSGGVGSLIVQPSCTSASSCVAVGIYNTATNGFPLIETWNGSGWADQEGALPSDESSSAQYAQLGAVSCATPTFCMAVGYYVATDGHEWGLINTFSGGAWTAVRAPYPQNVGAETNQFDIMAEVDCPTPGDCITVGGYNTLGNYEAGVVDTYSAGSWNSLPVPVPGNQVSPPVFNTTVSYARTIACYSPVACTVGGTYLDSKNNTQGLLDTYTGAQGYWLDASDGGIFTYPNNVFYGSTGGLRLNKPMVGMAATPDGQGYWLVASDGGVFSFGDAQFWGSRGGQPLNAPIVGMAPTPDGKGYWLVASDGGIFNYGDAGFYGSRGGQPINAPIVGMAATADGKGYWLVGADGGIYSYGDAVFYGSTGSIKLNKPVVGMAATPTGLGYWLVASDGGIFNYGNANFYGSTGSLTLNKPVAGMASSPSGLGYWLVASDGGIFNYGDAPFEGSAGSLHLNAPVVGMAGG